MSSVLLRKNTRNTKLNVNRSENAYESKKPIGTNKKDDIGNKHIKKIILKNPITGNNLDLFDEYRTIDFSCDVLQYLINNGKFTLTHT